MRIILVFLTFTLSACSSNKVMQSSLIESIPLSEVSEQYYIDKYLKDQQLDEIEGIWNYESGHVRHNDYPMRGPWKVMIIKNPNELESDYIGIVVKTGMSPKTTCPEERANACQLEPGDLVIAFNKTKTENLFYGIQQYINGSCNGVCFNSEARHTRFVRYADGIEMCNYIGDLTGEKDFASFLKNINEYPDYEAYKFHSHKYSYTLKKTFPAESPATIASLKKNIDTCDDYNLFGKPAGTLKRPMPSMLGVLLDAYMDSKDAKKSYVAPRSFESGMERLNVELINASKYFFQSQQQLHKAYGNNKEAQQIAAHLEYLSSSKYGYDEKIKNSIQVTTTSSKVLADSINDESIILTEEGRKDYSKSLPYIQQGIISTVKIVPLVEYISKNLSKQSSEEKLLASLEIISLLTYVPEYMGNMYESMRLALSDAKAKDIEGVQEMESRLGEL